MPEDRKDENIVFQFIKKFLTSLEFLTYGPAVIAFCVFALGSIIGRKIWGEHLPDLYWAIISAAGFAIGIVPGVIAVIRRETPWRGKERITGLLAVITGILWIMFFGAGEVFFLYQIYILLMR